MAVAAPRRADTVPDPFISRFREWIAGILAGVIVLGTVVIMIVALLYLDAAETETTFNRMKDLLLFINPLLGVVIGYYFNKVSTEARAESAEQNLQAASVTAQAAVNTAQQATEAQKETQERIVKVQATATEQRAALANLSEHAERLLKEASEGRGTLGPEGNGELEALRRDLRVALNQAQRVLTER